MEEHFDIELGPLECYINDSIHPFCHGFPGRIKRAMQLASYSNSTVDLKKLISHVASSEMYN